MSAGRASCPGHCGQQGFDCEGSQSFPRIYLEVLAAFLLQCRERGTGDPSDDAAWGLVAWERMLTALWRALTRPYPGIRPPLMCCGRRPNGLPAESEAKDSKAS